MEIVHKIPITEVPDIVTFTVAGIVVLIILASMIIPTLLYRKKLGSLRLAYTKASNIWLVVASICLLFVFLWCCFSNKLLGIETGKYKYKAKLDDTYTANELHDNYADISYDGEFYYFQDKK